MSCSGGCRYPKVHTITYLGEIRRQGTLCQLDNYCWHHRTPLEAPQTASDGLQDEPGAADTPNPQKRN